MHVCDSVYILSQRQVILTSRPRKQRSPCHSEGDLTEGLWDASKALSFTAFFSFFFILLSFKTSQPPLPSLHSSLFPLTTSPLPQIHCFSISLLKGAGLPLVSTEHSIPERSKTRHKPHIQAGQGNQNYFLLQKHFVKSLLNHRCTYDL